MFKLWPDLFHYMQFIGETLVQQPFYEVMAPISPRLMSTVLTLVVDNMAHNQSDKHAVSQTHHHLKLHLDVGMVQIAVKISFHVLSIEPTDRTFLSLEKNKQKNIPHIGM